jgi:hypothetical protein
MPTKIYGDMTDWWYGQSSCVFSPKISWVVTCRMLIFDDIMWLMKYTVQIIIIKCQQGIYL